MATTKLYLDTRAIKIDGTAPMKLSITKNQKTALLSLGLSLLPKQWDKRTGKIKSHPHKQYLDTFLARTKIEADTLILKLIESGEYVYMNAKDIRDRILLESRPKESNIINGPFRDSFVKFASLKKKNSTKDIYLQTLNRIIDYIGAPAINRLRFEDVTNDWLIGFDNFLSITSPSKNARNVHLRNIRAVFNDAIDQGITKHYPFRRFKIIPVATPKRALKVDQLRNLFALQPEPHAVQYQDMFKLIFFLIGINVIDLCNLKCIRDGRIEYYRSKTNRLYSIKVEPEAREIINKYRGRTHLLNILDRYDDYKNYLHRLNENLQKLGPIDYGTQCTKMYHPLFPQLTTYWARHTWATIAAQLDVPKDTIAAALGHGQNTVTDIYIDFDRRKIDAANRAVLDFVLYGHRPN